MSCTTCPSTTCTCCHVPNVLIDNDLTVNKTITVTSCGSSGNALVVNHSATCDQTSGDLVQINGTTGQSALRVTDGNVHIDVGDLILDSGSCCTTSDESLKTNIQPIDNALSLVEQMNGVRFDWKDASKQALRNHPNIGLVAQHVQGVVPEVVNEHDGHLTVSYTPLVAVLIEAVKELSAQVKQLQGNSLE